MSAANKGPTEWDLVIASPDGAQRLRNWEMSA
jgi:hypothetical protein